MTHRIDYIDYMKGILIFLVIVGHTIESQVPDFQYECSEIGGGMRFLWKCIYYFHMHLFFFISGWLSFKPGGGILQRSIVKKNAIRILSLLIPYLWLKPILVFLELRPVFWYLMTLLIMTVLLMLVKPFEGKKIMFWVVLAATYIIGLYMNLFIPYESYIGYEVDRVSLYIPFFYGGYLIHKYEQNLSFMKRPMFFNILLFAFFVFALQGFVVKMIVPFMLVLSLFLVFQNTSMSDNRLTRYIKFIGINSLYIYILHPFFVFSIYPIGDFYVNYAKSDKIVLNLTGLLLQASTSIILSIITLCFSLICMTFLKRLAIFDMLIFGNVKRCGDLFRH